MMVTTETEEVWTEKLVQSVTQEMLNFQWRRAINVGYPKSVVLKCWYIEDRMKSAEVAYC